MNMKKTIYSIVVSFLFLVSSCTLEQEVYNKINPGMFPQNAEDVNALVNSSAYYVFSPWGIFEVAAGFLKVEWQKFYLRRSSAIQRRFIGKNVILHIRH